MRVIFLDASGLIAVVNTDDQWHALAEPLWQELLGEGTHFITTSLVLVELGDGLARVRHRHLAVTLYDRLRNAPQIEIVPIVAEIEARAWELFRRRQDKEWGITDCASFVVLKDRGVQEAFTADADFEQAGFTRLLKR